MFKRLLFSLLLFIGFVPFSSTQLYAQDEKNHTKYSHTETDMPKEKKVDFILRLGQGGFKDSRSPMGKLGGKQIALDIKLRTLPIALSISSEYYKNNRFPIHSYEIEPMRSVNILYMAQLFNIERVNYFLGGGIGWLEVPKGEDYPDAKVKGNLYNLVAGINVRAFRKIGFYGVAKYLNAQKKVNNIKVIDFDECIILLGITFNFSL